MPEKMGMYPFIDTGPLADYTELSSKVMVCKRKYVTILFNIKEIRFGLVLVWMRAGINKRIHAHLFRHTRMTELAKTLPEQTLKQLAGWSGSSKMAEVLVLYEKERKKK